MFQLISLITGISLTALSAWQKDLDILFIIPLTASLLLIFLDKAKIQQQSAQTSLASLSPRQKNVFEILLLLLWALILFIPSMQFPPNLLDSLHQQGVAVPWYRELSWWNSWFAPAVYLLLWGITRLFVMLDAKPQPQK